mgnify:CR=1 FL=1
MMNRIFHLPNLSFLLLVALAILSSRYHSNAFTNPSISNNNHKFNDDASLQSQAQTSRSKGTGTSLFMASARPPPFPVRIAVMGGGNFGLALATVCARNGLPTTLLVRNQEIADFINTNHQHPQYMKNFTLPTRIRATADPNQCLPDATYVIHAVPCQYSREFLKSVAKYIPSNTPVLSASKGIETASLGFMNDILKECLGDDRPYAFLSGPSFAKEICQGVATAVVIASDDLDLARDLATLLSDKDFRCFTSKDVMGIEIGGAVKNVIAIAAGMCEGLGLGTNAMSGLVTRGCNEMRRLGVAFGARSGTIAGLSGTCVRVQDKITEGNSEMMMLSFSGYVVNIN